MVGFSLFLVACGGGGAGTPTPTPTPAPTPTPTPTPTPASPFYTTEFQANWGLEEVGALSAYDDGLSGAGIVIGTIDTGIDLDQTELDGNIHPASKDIFDGSVNTLTALSGATSVFSMTRTGGASLDDTDGHGTFVAGLIAAEKNDIRMHGLAFNAQVLSIRADDSDTCPDCAFDDNAIAASLNYAVANGANVVNISLGGTPANLYLEGAIRDATLAGVIIVISAGNAAEDAAPFTPSAEPDPLAMAALETWANGQVIIAGASNFLGAISEFSNRAGTGQAFYVLAPGENVYSTAVVSGTGESTFGTGSGTSFAAPAVAAAAGLLLEKFPALTASEVVDILLTSATDIGAVGVDAINGHGILNLTAAIAPIGTTSLTITTSGGIITADPADGGLVAGGIFGDGFTHGFQGGAIFTDVYDRAYATGFENQIRLVSPFTDFLARFESTESFETAGLAFGPNSTLTLSANYDKPVTAYEAYGLGLSSLQGGELDQTRLRVETKLDARTSMSFGFGGALEDELDQTGGRALSGSMLAQGGQLPWVSDSGLAATGKSALSGGRRVGASHRLGNGFILSVAASEDDITAPASDAFSGAPFRAATRFGTAARLARSSAAGEWAITLGRVEEVGVVLGSSSTGVLSLGKGAETDFVTLGGEAGIGRFGLRSLSLFGHVAGASIVVDEDAGSAFSGYQGLMASQYAFGLALDGAAFGGNRISLTLSQPLRLEAGRVAYGFASGYDYESDTPLYDDRQRGLTPSGRELDLELAWHFGLKDAARVSANLLYQREPGHVAGRDDAISVMLTSRSSF